MNAAQRRSIAGILFVAFASPAGAGEWERLAPLPDQHGVAGPFAGASHGALIVAGGANFPDKKPWDGGRKVWSDAVYVLDKPNGRWAVAGTLPRPLGYGVSVTHNNGVVCVGGSDADRHYADVFRLADQAGPGSGFASYAASVRERRRKLLATLETLDAELAQARETVADAFHELKKFELVQESRRVRDRAVAARREQFALDEMAAARHRPSPQ